MIMASKRKSDDVNVLAPDKTKKLSGSGGNCSPISDHYHNILNNDNQFKSLRENLFGMMKFKDRSNEKINFY